MKVARFVLDGRSRIGVIGQDTDRIHSVDEGFTNVIDLIRLTEAGFQFTEPASGGIPVESVRLLAPLVPERNIFCIGKNYHAHAREFAGSGFEAGAIKGQEIDSHPAIFSKPPSTIVGPDDQVELHPDATSAVDYEAELAVVIGRSGRDIPEERAYEHVFGYTIVNDVTARDRQKNHKQWLAGKGLDTFCPMGPWIVTADELEPENLDIRCWVNGDLRQQANTSDLIFTIPQIISAISAGLTLRPGDVIATGTPAGVGIGFEPARFLCSGDVVKITIGGIGTLSNTFR